MPRKIVVPNLDDFINRYVTGESEKKLAAELGMSRCAFRQRLVENGVTARNRSEGMIARWNTTSDDDRIAMVTNAHAAVRGVKRSTGELVKRAAVHEQKISNAPIVETTLYNLLRDNKLDATMHRAIGKYNVDVAVNTPAIAVEIFGGGWHAYGSHLVRFYERTKYILDDGWSVVVIWLDARRYPFSLACADYIISFAEELRLNPPVRGQYRVILGDGNLAPIAKSHLNTSATIERLGCSI